jgi:diacylglycerol O-acyltransferase
VTATALGAVDVFHLLNDREMRGRGLAGNHCAFVAELDGRLDVRRVGRRLEAAMTSCPELRFRLRGGFSLPAVGLGPTWEVSSDKTPPPLGVRSVGSDEERHVALEALLAERSSGDHPWALDLVRGPARDTLFLRWFHPLTDARGAERLLRWLGAGEGDEPPEPPPDAERFGTSDAVLASFDVTRRRELALAYRDHMLGHARRPVLSLWTAAGRPKRIGPATRMVRLLLSPDETRAFDGFVRREAKLAEALVIVLVAARVLDGLLVARGLSPARTLVPLPVSLDPKGAASRFFGNNITMMALALDRDELAHPAAALSSLAEQQRSIVRAGLDVGMIAALSFARYLPRFAYEALARLPFGGEMGSLVVSNPGAIPLATFAGLAVRDAFPMPAATVPPGFQLIGSRHGGRLSLAALFPDGLLSHDEVRGLAPRLRAALPL